MSVKNTKICPKCLSTSTQKIGTRNNIQRYQCNDCNKKFQLSRRTTRLEKVLFKDYIYRRQTLNDLSQKYNRSIRWV